MSKQLKTNMPLFNSASGDGHVLPVGDGHSRVPNNDNVDKLQPNSQRSSASNSVNKNTTGGSHGLRLGGLSRYLMEKAQSNDSGLDLSPATLQTLVHPLRSSNSSSSSLHVRHLFESPASSDDSPAPNPPQEFLKHDSENTGHPTPPASRMLLPISEQSHNSSETTVIEKTITDESTSKDITKDNKQGGPLNNKIFNSITSDRFSENSARQFAGTSEKSKQYYTGCVDNSAPKDQDDFHHAHGHSLGQRQDKSKHRISRGNSENTDPASFGSAVSRNNYQCNQNNGNFSSEIAAIISTGGATVCCESAKKPPPGLSGAAYQTPKPKSCKKKPPNPQSIKKQTGWKFLSEHVQDKEFLILEQLGKGGCGEVSLVMEKATRKQYALKVVQLHGIDDNAVQECINEVEMLIDLKGTDLVVDIQSWEFNRQEKTMKILMEKGQCDLNHTIQKAIKSKKPIKIIKLKYIWESMLTIVDKIHSRGIVHADLKPANFVWFDDCLKIIDFGIASRLQSDLTSIAMPNPKGTLNFISPEIIRQDDSGRSKLSPKSDIWALGCILYFMVYGRAPFDHIGHAVTKMNAILQGDIMYPTLPPHLHGSDVVNVLKLCFQLDYKRRPSAAELLRHRFLNS